MIQSVAPIVLPNCRPYFEKNIKKKENVREKLPSLTRHFTGRMVLAPGRMQVFVFFKLVTTLVIFVNNQKQKLETLSQSVMYVYLRNSYRSV